MTVACCSLTQWRGRADSLPRQQTHPAWITTLLAEGDVPVTPSARSTRFCLLGVALALLGRTLPFAGHERRRTAVAAAWALQTEQATMSASKREAGVSEGSPWARQASGLDAP